MSAHSNHRAAEHTERTEAWACAQNGKSTRLDAAEQLTWCLLGEHESVQSLHCATICIAGPFSDDDGDRVTCCNTCLGAFSGIGSSVVTGKSFLNQQPKRTTHLVCAEPNLPNIHWHFPFCMKAANQSTSSGGKNGALVRALQE
eukprot:2436887-Rhodomonas_salina.3